MNSQQTQKQIDDYADQNYKYGFETLIESERSEKGLNEDTIKFISAKKKEPQWMLDWRLKSFAKWKTMQDPSWANINFPKIYVFPCVLYAVKQYANANGKPVLFISFYFPFIFNDETFYVGLTGNIFDSSVNKDSHE